MPPDAATSHSFTEHFADGRPAAPRERLLAVEAPVAIEINGLGYAVMMATPADFADYALGFCLSEQLVSAPDQIVSVEAAEVPPQGSASTGWMLRIQLTANDAAPLMERARLRLSEGSCGLCGIERSPFDCNPSERPSTHRSWGHCWGFQVSHHSCARPSAFSGRKPK